MVITSSPSPCQSELQGQEELLSKERKEREHIISNYRKKTEKHKAPAEKVEGKVPHSTHTHTPLVSVNTHTHRPGVFLLNVVPGPGGGLAFTLLLPLLSENSDDDPSRRREQ